jgi:hypothetical protein
VDAVLTGGRADARDELVVDHAVVGVADNELAREDASGVEVGQAACIVEALARHTRPAIGERHLPLAVPITIDAHDSAFVFAQAHAPIVPQRATRAHP